MHDGRAVLFAVAELLVNIAPATTPCWRGRERSVACSGLEIFIADDVTVCCHPQGFR